VEVPRTTLHWILVASSAGAVAFFCIGLTSYFERRDDRPGWVRAVHNLGMSLSIAHLAALILLQPRSDAFAVAGIVMYTLAVAVFLSAIEAADRTRLQRMYLDYPLPDRLITDGPFHWVRHPFYLGYIIGAIAPAVAVAHPVILVISIVMVAITVNAAFREERVWLASPRADEYREYRRRTGMFLPFGGRPTRSYDPHA
jgi:protein-S-isoprenylcysteine O-methyltransferase Ste14